MIKTQTLKGFRDFLPEDTIKRQYVIEKIRHVYERFGFDPLETPALEYADTLLGKYGDEADKLLYTFVDHGGRRVGLRYDQTVPLARIIAQYPELPKPFKRYQIQPVWRAENTQKGRFREFIQCDADIIGDEFSPSADAEILSLFWEVFNTLGLNSIKIKVNSRIILNKLINQSINLDNQDITSNNNHLPKTSLDIIRIIDKRDKIGIDCVREELRLKELTYFQIDSLLNQINSLTNLKYSDDKIKELDQDLSYSMQIAVEKYKIPQKNIEFDPALARGLDYYTGVIFEAIDQNYKGSVGGGGRYNNLIGSFTNNNINAVGFALGFDRTLEILHDKKLLPDKKTVTEILIAIIEDWKNVFPEALKLTNTLRKKNINTEIYLNPQESKLDKQVKYAINKGIKYIVFVGNNEITSNKFSLRNNITKEKSMMTVSEIIETLKKEKRKRIK